MGILTAITSLFSTMFTNIIGWINSVVSLFWGVPEGGSSAELTTLGVLCLIGLSISVFFLVVHFILQFFHFRAN